MDATLKLMGVVLLQPLGAALLWGLAAVIARQLRRLGAALRRKPPRKLLK